MQPRILLPLATVALALAVPTAANAAVSFQKQGDAVELTGDGANDAIALNVNDAGLITHNLTGATGIKDNTDFDPDPAEVEIAGLLVELERELVDRQHGISVA